MTTQENGVTLCSSCTFADLLDSEVVTYCEADSLETEAVCPCARCVSNTGRCDCCAQGEA